MVTDSTTGSLSGDVQDLLGRSRRLGADRANTSFGDGNTSAKRLQPDPVRARTPRSGGSLPVTRGAEALFANGWGQSRAAVYGVQEKELGRFYAERTLLKQEVLPEDVAAPVFALGGDLALTTRLLIPVDSGLAAAFLR